MLDPWIPCDDSPSFISQISVEHVNQAPFFFTHGPHFVGSVTATHAHLPICPPSVFIEDSYCEAVKYWLNFLFSLIFIIPLRFLKTANAQRILIKIIHI
jgi:hypothetical protein